VTKRLRLFAGPNGSGKSSIEKLVSERYNIGNLINADVIEQMLREKGQMSFDPYGITITTLELKRSIISSGFNLKEDVSTLVDHLTIRKNILTIRNEEVAYGYLGAILSEVIRNKSLDGNKTFSFESVMSHPGKLDFIAQATRKGFKTYLYFISTESPEINIGRVQSRVQEGGHDVPVDKIKNRYTRSLDLLIKALELVDRAFIFDNSGKDTILLAEKDDEKLKIFEKKVPKWFDTYVIKRIT